MLLKTASTEPKSSGTYVMVFFNQIRGTYYIGIDQLGAGSRWRRTTGQEVYSPLLLAFTHEVCFVGLTLRTI